MTKDVIFGVLLLGVMFLIISFCIKFLLNKAYTNNLGFYFCSRTDNSYNVAVSYDNKNILIKDKLGAVKTFNLDETIAALKQTPTHRLITSVLNKLENKQAFNFRVDNVLKVCGLYKDPVHFKEVFAFKGDTKIDNLFEFIISKDIGWKKEVQQDEDLVYIVLYLFVKNYFQGYIFILYKEFIVFYNPSQTPVFRLDIDYKKVFGIDVTGIQDDYLFQVQRRLDIIIVFENEEKYKITPTTIFMPFTNPIALTLLKKYEIGVKEAIVKENIESLKEIVNVNKIKSDKQFMELINRVKTDPKIHEMLPKKT